MFVFIVASKASVVSCSRSSHCCCRHWISRHPVRLALQPLWRRDLAIAFLAKVARQGNRLAAFGLDQFDYFTSIGLFGGVIADRNIGALASVGNRRGTPHSGVAASNQSLAPSESP